MKYIIIGLFSLGSFAIFPSCTTVENREPSTHSSRTTTTESSPTIYGSRTESRTTTSY